ncbi:autorepressor SdpR family transcription factor [Patescibacteria group bacterium]|nr:autorepressor SdpR family transcription factor [Patescibacteria group bacterium]
MDKAFKALGDPTRRKILQLLKKGDFPAGEIQKHFKITAPSLSHHLDILKRSELVISERKGQFIYYSLNTSVFQEVVKGLMNLIK